MKYCFRSLLKFSIRDLLWITFIVALAVGWWLDRTRLLEESQYIEAQLEFAKSQAAAEEAVAKAQAAYAKARAEFDDLRPTSDEGPVLGYKLLGPPPKHTEP